MGSTTVKVNIQGSDPSKVKEVELLVDTASVYTWVEREVLEGLGLKPMRKRRFKTIDGRVLERDVGEAIVKYDDEHATTAVVFAERGDERVLGVHALEGLWKWIPLGRCSRKSKPCWRFELLCPKKPLHNQLCLQSDERGLLRPKKRRACG